MTAHDEYRQGFAEGYRSVKGNNVAVPAIPAMSAVPAGRTAFQVGIQEGIKAATR